MDGVEEFLSLLGRGPEIQSRYPRVSHLGLKCRVNGELTTGRSTFCRGVDTASRCCTENNLYDASCSLRMAALVQRCCA